MTTPKPRSYNKQGSVAPLQLDRIKPSKRSARGRAKGNSTKKTEDEGKHAVEGKEAHEVEHRRRTPQPPSGSTTWRRRRKECLERIHSKALQEKRRGHKFSLAKTWVPDGNATERSVKQAAVAYQYSKTQTLSARLNRRSHQPWSTQGSWAAARHRQEDTNEGVLPPRPPQPTDSAFPTEADSPAYTGIGSQYVSSRKKTKKLDEGE